MKPPYPNRPPMSSGLTKTDDLIRMAEASLRVAEELEHQATRQRRAAEILFAQSIIFAGRQALKEPTNTTEETK